MTDDELAARLATAAAEPRRILDGGAIVGAAPMVLAEFARLVEAAEAVAAELAGRTVVLFPDPGAEPTP